MVYLQLNSYESLNCDVFNNVVVDIFLWITSCSVSPQTICLTSVCKSVALWIHHAIILPPPHPPRFMTPSLPPPSADCTCHLRASAYIQDQFT